MKKGKVLGFILALCMLVAILPMTVMADEQTHGAFTVKGDNLSTDVSFNEATGVLTITGDVTVKNKDGVDKATDRIEVSNNATVTLDGVNIDVSSADNVCALEVTDNANIILADGSENTLTSGKNCAGLQVGSGATVIIDDDDANGNETETAGKLTATGGTYAAGIGGGFKSFADGSIESSGGKITISGGDVTATGNSGGAGTGGGAGIGGGAGGAGGKITISDGIVNATGNNGGAGIGGGVGGAGGIIEISNGTVNATGNNGGAGIGGGAEGDGGTITISGGTVTATATAKTNFYGGAGIGGGVGGAGGIIEISNGTVNATGNNGGAGIGGGAEGDGGTITISGGTVNATGGGSYAVAIGASAASGGGTTTIEIDFPMKIATSTSGLDDCTAFGPYISGTTIPRCAKVKEIKDFTVTGDTKNYTYSGGVLTITGDVTVKNTNGIATAKDTIVVSDDATVTLAGVNIDVSTPNACAFKVTGKATIKLADDSENILTSGNNCAGLQVGSGATVTIDDGANGNTEGTAGSLTAKGGSHGAGIGGGDGGDGVTITISGGEVTATGGSSAAGIGGGYKGAGGEITISGGDVTATGGDYAAGIGGGYKGAGGIITISGGSLTATGGTYAAGIGGGSDAGAGGTITISGGTVTAEGGSSAAAAIGAGDGGGSGGSITIESHMVIATDGTSLGDCTDFDTYDSDKTIPQYAKVKDSRPLTVTEGTGNYTYLDGVLTITGDVTVKNTNGVDKAATDKIVVSNNATVTLAGVNINVSDEDNPCAFKVETGAKANIILADGSENTLISGNERAGLQVGSDATVIIDDSDADSDAENPGSLTAVGSDGGAGIGGGWHGAGGTIEISGGTVTAKGSEGGGAGIGGGFEGDGGTITISGGTVTAKNGAGAAGIGGGYQGAGGTITISGGTVNATGGTGENDIGVKNKGGAGIGGGDGDGKAGGTIEISGGDVTATGGYNAAGIGGGWHGAGGTIKISGGTVTAKGGSYAIAIGAGADYTGDAITTIEIDFPMKIATSTSGLDDCTAFGKYISGSTTIPQYAKVKEIKDFTVEGGIEDVDYTYTGGVLTITGDVTVKNTNGVDEATDTIVVRGDVTETETETATVTLDGVNIDVSGTKDACAFKVTDNANIILADDSENILTSGNNCAGLQVGSGATVTIDDGANGNTEGTAGSLTAKGGSHGAGIGGGNGKAGGTIIISGGTVTAEGGYGGAGIGGGEFGAGGTITISGGTVNAISGSFAAGIGGGYKGAGGTIEISGGDVTAKGGVANGGANGGAAAIGAGANYTGDATDVTINLPMKIATDGTNLNDCTAFGPYISGTTIPRCAKVKEIKDFTVTGDTGDTENYTYENNVLTITGGNVTVSNTKGVDKATDTIVVSGGTATVTLDGVNIDVSGTKDACAFKVTGKATIKLADDSENTLKSGENYAGLQVGSDAKVTIDDANGNTENAGKLTATGGDYAAGIGGGYEGSGGEITISGGDVTATGGAKGAGIGGGKGGAGGTITISGGTVTATGDSGGAGIGGGFEGKGGTITISGGTVTATGGENATGAFAAGIGAGIGGAGGRITISGGLKVKTSSANTTWAAVDLEKLDELSKYVLVGAFSTAKEITKFEISDQAGDSIIDEDNHTITVVIIGALDENYTPTITISEKATVNPESGEENTFTGGSATYTVKAEDATTQEYTVTVIPLPYEVKVDDVAAEYGTDKDYHYDDSVTYLHPTDETLTVKKVDGVTGTATLKVGNATENAEVAIPAGDNKSITVQKSDGSYTVKDATYGGVEFEELNIDVNGDVKVLNGRSITIGNDAYTAGSDVTLTANDDGGVKFGGEVTLTKGDITVTAKENSTLSTDNKLTLTEGSSVSNGTTTVTVPNDDNNELTATFDGSELKGTKLEIGTDVIVSSTSDDEFIWSVNNAYIQISDEKSATVQKTGNDQITVTGETKVYADKIETKEVTLGDFKITNDSGMTMTFGANGTTSIVIPANGTITIKVADVDVAYKVTKETTVTVDGDGNIKFPASAELTNGYVTIKTNTSTDSTINANGTMTLSTGSTVNYTNDSTDNTVEVTGTATYDGAGNGTVSVTVSDTNALTYGSTEITNATVNISDMTTATATVDDFAFAGTSSATFKISNDHKVTLTADSSYTVATVPFTVPSGDDMVLDTSNADGITITDGTVVHGYALTGGKIIASGLTATQAECKENGSTVTFASTSTDVLNIDEDGISSDSDITATYGTKVVTIDNDAEIDATGAVTSTSEVTIDNVTYTVPATVTGKIKISNTGVITYPAGTKIVDGGLDITLGAQTTSTELGKNEYPENTKVEYTKTGESTVTNTITLDVAGEITDTTVTAKEVTVNDAKIVSTNDTVSVVIATGITTIKNTDSNTTTVTPANGVTIELTDGTVSAAGVTKVATGKTAIVTTTTASMDITGGEVAITGAVTDAEVIKVGTTTVAKGKGTGTEAIDATATGVITAKVGNTITDEDTTSVTVRTGKVTVKENKIVMDEENKVKDQLTFGTNNTIITAVGDVTLSDSKVNVPASAEVKTGANPTITVVTAGGTVNKDGIVVAKSTTVAGVTVTADGTGDEDTVTTDEIGVTTTAKAVTVTKDNCNEVTVAANKLVKVDADGTIVVKEATVNINDTDKVKITGTGTADVKITMADPTSIVIPANGTITIKVADDDVAYKVTKETTVTVDEDGNIKFPANAVIEKGDMTITIPAESATDAKINADGTMELPINTEIKNADNEKVTLNAEGTMDTDDNIESKEVTLNDGKAKTTIVAPAEGEDKVTVSAEEVKATVIPTGSTISDDQEDTLTITTVTDGVTAAAKDDATVITVPKDDAISSNGVKITMGDAEPGTDVKLSDKNIAIPEGSKVTADNTTDKTITIEVVSTTGSVNMVNDEENDLIAGTVTAEKIKVATTEIASTEGDLTATLEGKVHFPKGGTVTTYDNGKKTEKTVSSNTNITVVKDGNVSYPSTGSSVSYGSSVASSSNGKTTISKDGNKQGATVTITTKPDDGYVVASVTVTYADGREVGTIIDNGDGTFSFKQPIGNVKINVVYALEGTVEPEVKPETEQDFIDVDETDWFSGAVDWAVKNGITTGKTETIFDPKAVNTRAEAVTFLYRAMGEPEHNGSSDFTDTAADGYYNDAVLWAVENGIVTGIDDTTFSPTAACTRGQIVTMLWRMNGKPVVEGENPFTDMNANAYYYDAVLWAVENGITKGIGATTFGANNNCSRAEIVTFLQRVMAE